MHGRDLLKQGLVKQIEDGRDTKVWLENWVVDVIPRPPNYNQDVIVDLTLTVNDIIDANTGRWNAGLVRQLIAEEDVELVLNTKLHVSRLDCMRWGFSQHCRYDSKSGYKLIEAAAELHSGFSQSLPPLETQLWRKLWKTKTSPKLRHFLWRVLFGALAVKSQLRCRGITLDTTFSWCRQGPESICHVLFHCSTAQQVW